MWYVGFAQELFLKLVERQLVRQEDTKDRWTCAETAGGQEGNRKTKTFVNSSSLVSWIPSRNRETPPTPFSHFFLILAPVHFLFHRSSVCVCSCACRSVATWVNRYFPLWRWWRRTKPAQPLKGKQNLNSFFSYPFNLMFLLCEA